MTPREGEALPSPFAGEGDPVPLRRAGRGGEWPEAGILLTRAKSMRSAMTDAGTALWRILRAKRLDACKFKRQMTVGPYIADFVCYGSRLIIEADGSQHAESESDARRTAWLESQGFQVLRFWNADILQRPDDIAQTIYATLGAPSPRSPSASRPLPRGERAEQD